MANKSGYYGKTRGSFKKGEGGRPKGCKNKFTRVKEALVEVFEEVGGKEAFKKSLIRDDGSMNLPALDRIISILPKEVNHGGLGLTQNNLYLNVIEKANSERLDQIEAQDGEYS